ncbi:hypothetical protein MATR_35980 [Marivirga tractuosa]|uniref:Lipoprotein n=1 Tax=Marivirga tractuosa (strain ATCC 23168 / DSM 4126 / NBRC 15989 / NCIMB 1408 / VKM B-1430 / H-43) TaxID=643867 RepID=E4TPJ2_MARTH|nr:hypothetical protein [Marivirga tractuosa]ADR22556.1 hypothetical protein Ftrac_2578 [Marivirga tractuosa DSM 4126]BDD16773.1 hypothetical protein MATR_35980 [Marivirga tractuosa]
MKKIIRKPYFLFGILVSMFIGGCYSELSDLEIGKLQWSPELGVPLVDSKFTLIDILEANSSDIDVSADPSTDVLVIRISDDSLFSQFATDYFSLSNQVLNIPPIILTPEEINDFNANGQVTVSREELIDYPNQGDLDRIIIDQGTIQTEVTENFPADVDLSFDMEDPTSTPILNYSNLFSYDGFNPISSDQSTDQFNDVEFTFNADPSLRQLLLSFDVTLTKVNGQNLVFGANSIDLNIGVEDLAFEALYGDLSSQNISTEENTIQTDAFSQNELLTEIDYYFEDPQFRLVFTNSMGVPIRFDVNNFTTYKDGAANQEPINTAIELEAATTGSPTTSGNNFDNIFKSIINNVPDSVSLQVDGLIDPNNTPDNFVTKDSYFQAGYEVSLPLEFRLGGLEINETVSLDGIDPQELQYALFKFTSENSLPIDLNFRADLLREDSTVVMNLFDGKFLAGGSVESPEPISDLIRLEDDPETTNNELEELINVKRVGIRATISTTNNGSEVVTITSGASVKFNLAVQAKYNVNF